MDKEKRVKIIEVVIWVLLGIGVAGWVLIGVREERKEREKTAEIAGMSETKTDGNTYNYGQ